MEYSIEEMSEEHRPQVVEIYNYFIENTFAAYPGTAMDDSIFDRFLALSQGYPSLVARDHDENVVGFAFLQPYHPAESFRKTAVASYFILPEHTRKASAPGS
jgi:phosphinothricin acetyltransferase